MYLSTEYVFWCYVLGRVICWKEIHSKQICVPYGISIIRNDLAYQIDLALNSLKSPWMSKNRTLLNIQSDSLFMYLPIVEDGQVTGHFTTLSESCVNFCGGVFRTRVKKIFFYLTLKKVVKKCENLDFKVNFQCQKSFEAFWFFHIKISF